MASTLAAHNKNTTYCKSSQGVVIHKTNEHIWRINSQQCKFPADFIIVTAVIIFRPRFSSHPVNETALLSPQRVWPRDYVNRMRKRGRGSSILDLLCTLTAVQRTSLRPSFPLAYLQALGCYRPWEGSHTGRLLSGACRRRRLFVPATREGRAGPAISLLLPSLSSGTLAPYYQGLQRAYLGGAKAHITQPSACRIRKNKKNLTWTSKKAAPIICCCPGTIIAFPNG